MNLDWPIDKRQLASKPNAAAKAGTPRLQEGTAIEDEQVAKGQDYREVQVVQRSYQMADHPRQQAERAGLRT